MYIYSMNDDDENERVKREEEKNAKNNIKMYKILSVMGKRECGAVRGCE